MSKRAVSVALVAGIALGLLIHAPGIGAGYVGDDHLQNAMLDGTYPVRRAIWDLYAFVDAPRGDVPALREAGTMPWWTHPDLELTAFRPLSSLLLAFDHHVLGLGALGKHLHSVAWWAALVVAQAALVRRRMPTPVAVVAVLLFALDPAHASPMAWIANRTALVSALFGTLALLAQARWREGGGRRWGWGAVALWALALAGGEYGFCMVAYGLAYELIAAPRGWARRALGVAAFAGPTLVYAAVRGAIGYGAHGSSVYVDTSLGGGFYKLALIRWLALLGDESWLMASEASSWAAMVHLPSLVFLLVALVGFGALFRNAVREWPDDSRRLATALLAGAALAAMPTVSAFPSTRLLVPASVGGSVAISIVLVHAARAARDRARRWPARLAQGAALLTVAGLHVAIGPLATYLRGRLWADVHALGDTLYLAAPVADAGAGRAPNLVLLSAPDPMTVLYPPYVNRQAGRAVSGRWRVLCACTPGQTFVRTGPDTLEVLGDSGFIVGTHAWLLRAADAGFRTGERITTSTMEVEIVEQQGGRARRVRYRFDRSLDDPSLVLMVFTDAGIERLAAPPIGGHVPVPDVFSKLHAATAPWAQEGASFRPGAVPQGQ